MNIEFNGCLETPKNKKSWKENAVRWIIITQRELVGNRLSELGETDYQTWRKVREAGCLLNQRKWWIKIMLV